MHAARAHRTPESDVITPELNLRHAFAGPQKRLTLLLCLNGFGMIVPRKKRHDKSQNGRKCEEKSI